MSRRLCPGCRSLDGDHKFDGGCTLADTWVQGLIPGDPVIWRTEGTYAYFPVTWGRVVRFTEHRALVDVRRRDGSIARIRVVLSNCEPPSKEQVSKIDIYIPRSK